MKKFHIAVLPVLVVLLPVASSAQGLSPGGVYSSSTVSLQVIVLDPGTQTVAAEALVSVGTCSGRMAGNGKMDGHVLTFASSASADPGGKCKITAEFDSKWKEVKVKEGDGCGEFHGASCGWEGQSAKRIHF